MQGIIYLIRNRINGKSYVGQTTRLLSQRFTLHKYDCRRGENRPLYRAVRKYGWQSFELVIIGHAASQHSLDNLERLWILLLKSADRQFGYNLTWGGERGLRTEEVRQKLRDSHLGQKAWNKGKKMERPAWNKGKSMSKEFGQRISERQRGRPISDKAKKLIAEKIRIIALNRLPMPQAVKDKIAATLKRQGCRPPVNSMPGKQNPCYGRKYIGKNLWKATQLLGVKH